MNPFLHALKWLLEDRVKHGDVHQARTAQNHLNQIEDFAEFQAKAYEGSSDPEAPPPQDPPTPEPPQSGE